MRILSLKENGVLSRYKGVYTRFKTRPKEVIETGNDLGFILLRHGNKYTLEEGDILKLLKRLRQLELIVEKLSDGK